MKQIIKENPNFYKEFVLNKKPKTWSELSTKIGRKARKYILENEQNNQCAYTEKRIDLTNSHIDHFFKQNFSKQTSLKRNVFNWSNLLVSCNTEYYGAKYKDKIITKNDYENLINPVVENPNKYLKYSIVGKIIAKNNNKKGKITIDLFNLNDRELIEQRKIVALQIKAMQNQIPLDEAILIIGKFESFVRQIYQNF